MHDAHAAYDRIGRIRSDSLAHQHPHLQRISSAPSKSKIAIVYAIPNAPLHPDRRRSKGDTRMLPSC